MTIKVLWYAYLIGGLIVERNNMPIWDGNERRKNPTDHDTLICLTQIMANHVKNFEAHIITDNNNFKDIGDKLWNHAKYIYMGLGIVGVVEVIIGLHK